MGKDYNRDRELCSHISAVFGLGHHHTYLLNVPLYKLWVERKCVDDISHKWGSILSSMQDISTKNRAFIGIQNTALQVSAISTELATRPTQQGGGHTFHLHKLWVEL